MEEWGEWTFDSYTDFLADLSEDYCSLHVFTQEGEVFIWAKNEFSWTVDSSDKARIVSFETQIEAIISDNWVKDPAKESIKNRTIFIGHGRHQDWRELKDHLADKHGIKVESYESASRAGHTIRDVLDDMLDNSSLAILVHTPEDDLVDGSKSSRPNVIHETGLFQGRLGFSRAILLMKDGVNEFSNVFGVQQIRYTDIKTTYGEVLAWIKRESLT